MIESEKLPAAERPGARQYDQYRTLLKEAEDGLSWNRQQESNEVCKVKTGCGIIYIGISGYMGFTLASITCSGRPPFSFVSSHSLLRGVTGVRAYSLLQSEEAPTLPRR
jgi:hypothetical protein